MYFCKANLKIYMSKQSDSTNILLKHIIGAIQEVKGKEIISLNLTKIDTAICKYFVICTGMSNIHVNAIEKSIKKYVLEKLIERPYNTEGNNIAEWVVIDYSDIIIHIFQKKIRNLYNLEDLWGDADFINYTTS